MKRVLKFYLHHGFSYFHFIFIFFNFSGPLLISLLLVGRQYDKQVRSGSLHQLNELEEMRKKLEARKLVMENLLMQFKTESEEIKNKRGQLLFGNRSLQVVWEALSKARAQLMVIAC